MHFLDLIMYVVIAFLLWQFLRIISRGQFTEELGAIIGLLIMFLFTSIYVTIFVFYGANWIDFHWTLKMDNFFKW